MSANVDKVKSMLDGVNSHDLSRAAEFDSESIVNYEPSLPKGVAGKAAELQGISSLFAAFPDVQFITEQILGDRDWVAVKGVLTGTNTGPLLFGKRRIKPTFKRFSSSRTVFHKFQDGKIVESHGYFDPREAWVQLGLVNRNVNRTLTVILLGLALMTYQSLLVTSLAYSSGAVTSTSAVLFLLPFFFGMLPIFLGLRALRRGLIRPA